ncbi:MAG: hypothetical protein IJ846_00630, partial [Alphaproteobacteria bacterium]|nr:hypothetical protein [Alphaproteobacteria bacterium]
MEKNNLEKKNLILAIVFSAVFLFAVDARFPPAQQPTAVVPENQKTAPAAPVPSAVQKTEQSFAPAPAAVVGSSKTPEVVLTQEQAVNEYPHIAIK